MMVHSDKRLSAALAELKKNLLKMGVCVEEMIASAMQSVELQNNVLAQDVLNRDAEVNQLEMLIDEKCVETLVLHQPAASDLRFITMGIRLASDLERMGDLAVNMAERSLELKQPVPEELLRRLPQVASLVKNMLTQAMRAFVDKDENMARQVCLADDEVDRFNHEFFAMAVNQMKQDQSCIEQAIRLVSICRYLERIADHSTNVAEEVVFMVSGKDIRHQV